jgi:3-oxoacyl-[acyl-carrier-protein] synthase III
MRYNGITIAGIGSALPKRVVTNDEIATKIDTSDEWIFNKLGVKERRIASDIETPSVLGYRAALSALKDANLSKEDLDLIIVATSSPEQISPSTACIIHNKLKIKKNIPAFDINAVCSGFVYAMSIAAPLITSGTYKNILIIATETYSKITNWDDQHCVFFGDGAGAVVLSNSEEGYFVTKLEANGKETGMTGFSLPLDKPFVMKGKEVWEQATKVLPQSIKDILAESKLQAEDIKMVIPHQPSINILKEVANKVGIPMGKVKTIMDKYANIAGASIPIALDEAIKKGEIEFGDKVILTAIGSGWTWGSILLYYKK